MSPGGDLRSAISGPRPPGRRKIGAGVLSASIEGTWAWVDDGVTTCPCRHELTSGAGLFVNPLCRPWRAPAVIPRAPCPLCRPSRSARNIGTGSSTGSARRPRPLLPRFPFPRDPEPRLEPVSSASALLLFSVPLCFFPEPCDPLSVTWEVCRAVGKGWRARAFGAASAVPGSSKAPASAAAATNDLALQRRENTRSHRPCRRLVMIKTSEAVEALSSLRLGDNRTGCKCRFRYSDCNLSAPSTRFST